MQFQGCIAQRIRQESIGIRHLQDLMGILIILLAMIFFVSKESRG
jgi:hypothetical protein